MARAAGFLALCMLFLTRASLAFDHILDVHNDTQLLEALKALKDSTLVKIHEGKYSLNETIDLSSLNTVALRGVAQSYEDVEIICSRDVGLSVTLSKNFTIENLTFRHCGALRNSSSVYKPDRNTIEVLQFRVGILLVYCRDILIQDAQIVDSPGIGLTFYDVNGKVNFSSVVIRNNSRIPSFSKSTVTVGGGLYIEFTKNHAPWPFGYQGDPYHHQYISDSEYIVQFCNFNDNNASWLEGKSFIDYPGDQHVAFGRGGAVSVFVTGNASRNVFVIKNSTFNSNQALWGAGMFLELHDNADRNDVIVSGSFFQDNWSKMGGGGARMGTTVVDRPDFVGNHFWLEDCHFIHNNALLGGGLSVFGVELKTLVRPSLPWIDIEDCVFERNLATMGAALAFACSDSVFGIPFTAQLKSCRFTGNDAMSQSGTSVGQGSLWSYATHLVFKGVTQFTENINTALLLEVRSSVTVFDKVIFKGNTGFKGGAAALFGDSFFLLMEKSEMSFISNTCTEKGGAMYVHWNGPPIRGLQNTEVSTHCCFFRYHGENGDEFSNPDAWDTKIEFIKNKAVGKNASGDAIFADTLQGCMTAGQNISKVLEWRPFYYEPNLGITTNPEEIHFSSEYWEVSPGETFSPQLTLHDEKKNPVYSVIEVSIDSKQNQVQLGTPSNFFLVRKSLDELQLHGAEGAPYNVTITTTGGQIVQWKHTTKLRDCINGFHFDEEKEICVCSTGIVSRCSKLQKVFIPQGTWAGKNSKGEFVSYECPEEYCNCIDDDEALPGECLYVEGKMCKGNREGVLCGSCKKNYSALIGSIDCVPDGKYSDWYALLILCYFAGVFVVVYLVLLIDLDIFTGYLNAWLFSYQVINVIVSSPIYAKADNFLKFLIGIAHVELDFGEHGGLYQFKGMTSLYKLGYNFMIPFSVIIILFILGKMSQTWPNSKMFRNLNRNSPYRAFCTLFVWVYSTLTQKSLEILHVAKLGDTYVLFKDGDVSFLEGVHIPFAIFALLVIFIVVVPVPAALIFRTKFRDCCSCIISPALISVLDTFQSCFRAEQAWFAGFYFAARFVFLIWGIYIPSGEINDLLIQFSCIAVLLVFLKCWPYRDEFNWINKGDFILLLNLCAISLINGSVSDIDQRHVDLISGLEWVIIVLMYVPFAYAVVIIIIGLKRRFCDGCFNSESVLNEFPSEFVEPLDQPLVG